MAVLGFRTVPHGRVDAMTGDRQSDGEVTEAEAGRPGVAERAWLSATDRHADAADRRTRAELILRQTADRLARSRTITGQAAPDSEPDPGPG